MKAVLLVSHGSRSQKTKEEIARLVNELKKESRVPIVEYAFLEIESPSIPEGIEICARKGATKIIVLLNFLNAGQHVDQDIPRIVKAAAPKYPKISFQVTAPVGRHSKMRDLFLSLIED